MGLHNNAESATEFRNNCPPPSSMLPSITSGSVEDAMIQKNMREYFQGSTSFMYDLFAGVTTQSWVIIYIPTGR